MSKHGKWQSNSYAGGVFITMSDGSPVFVAEALGATKEIKVKRARLIAAAPDLLAACEEAIGLIETLEYDGEPVRKNNYKTIVAAIERATIANSEG